MIAATLRRFAHAALPTRYVEYNAPAAGFVGYWTLLGVPIAFAAADGGIVYQW